MIEFFLFLIVLVVVGGLIGGLLYRNSHSRATAPQYVVLQPGTDVMRSYQGPCNSVHPGWISPKDILSLPGAQISFKLEQHLPDALGGWQYAQTVVTLQNPPSAQVGQPALPQPETPAAPAKKPPIKKVENKT